MGKTTARITLTNALDWLHATSGGDGGADTDVRQVALTAYIDTGSTELCIPDEIARELELCEVARTTIVLADESTREAWYAGPLHIEILGRSMLGQALVPPEGTEPLLGVIPLESMDLVVDPERRELRVADKRGPRTSVK